MTSTFLALQIGYSALQTSQQAVDTSGNNIANAGSDGYAREALNPQSASSLTVYAGQTVQIGTGVQTNSIQRITSDYLDEQYRNNNASDSYWTTQNQEINNVASVFNEPQGSTLRSSIDAFYAGWNQLANQPGDSGVRAGLYESAQQLAAAFHTTANAINQDMSGYQTQLNSDFNDMVSQAQSLATINAQIQKTSGQVPNNLLDQRDALLDKLSSDAQMKVSIQSDQSVNVSLSMADGSSLALVTGGTVNSAVTSTTGAALAPQLANESGSLKSFSDMINYAQNTLNSVNQLALSISQQVDAVQSAGYGINGQTGNPLFNSSTLTSSNAASQIAINSTISSATHPGDYLAAATQNTTGGVNQDDGSNANAIFGQLNAVDQSYSGIVTQLGIDGQAAIQRNQTFDSLKTQSTELRQSVRGVDINEEVANMVKAQQTYGAATQFIKVFNDMLTNMIQTL